MKQNLRRFTVAVAVALIVSAFQARQLLAADRTCLNYEPATVTLTGTITRHMEYGAPGYGEDPAHDEKEIYWYLDLDNPICVNGKDDASPEADEERDVHKLQIVYENGYPKGGDRINHRVSITGTLSHAITGHHHTAVLITAHATAKVP